MKSYVLFRRIGFRDGTVANFLVDVFSERDDAERTAKKLTDDVAFMSGCSLVKVEGTSGSDTGLSVTDLLSQMGIDEVDCVIAECEVVGSLLQAAPRKLILPS
jgi:hypothetical protein